MAVSAGYADNILATYFRAKMNDLGPPPFEFKDLAALKAHWEARTPGWFASFRSAIESSGLTFTQANEAMKTAAMQWGVPSTPKILFDELYAKSNDTRFSRAWDELISSAAKKAVVVSQKTQETVENAAAAVSNVVSYGPYLYAAAGAVGLLIVASRLAPKRR